jgi:hypothetical protein
MIVIVAQLVATEGALAQVRRTLAPARLPILTVAGPTGPAPTGLTVGGTPLTARLSWSPAPNATSYAVLRADGPGATPVLRTPAGFTATTFTETVPDPRITYDYVLTVTYADGTWGEARIPYTSPPPTNPASLRAKSLGRAAFRLVWGSVAGAISYRVDGAAIPNTGFTVPTTYTNVINVPPGPQSWQVVALFPGGFADYNTPTKTSVIHRVAPNHPRWLSKYGTGDPNTAATHANALCSVNPGCRGLLYPLVDAGADGYYWGYGGKAYANGGPLHANYNNVTELGSSRSTYCEEQITKADRYTICTAEGPNSVSLIIKGTQGTRFGFYLPASGAPSSYWVENWSSSPMATFDSEGPKYVPQVCMSCHGGTFNPRTGLVDGATLLPVDPGLVDAGANRAAAEEPIRRVNAAVFMSNPSPSVVSYITGMYGGRVGIPGAVAAPNYVPTGWASEANLYTSVVKKNCAMCHLATNPAYDFLSAGNFLQNKALIQAAVCGAASMPHAEVPFNRFWTEDTGPIYVPGLLAARLGYPSCP